jgi:hypothetical protein
MPFREKLAWAACLSTIVLWGGYLAAVWRAVMAGEHIGFGYLALFGALVAAQAVIMATVSIAGALVAPGDARARADERERAIGRRAASVAYTALILGVVAVIVGMHHGLRGVPIIFALFGAIALAEATRYGAQIVGYRRGW